MNLELATSEALVSELFARYPDAIFMGMKASFHDVDQALYYQRFQGHTVVLQGMCARMIRRVQDSEDYSESTEEEL